MNFTIKRKLAILVSAKHKILSRESFYLCDGIADSLTKEEHKKFGNQLVIDYFPEVKKYKREDGEPIGGKKREVLRGNQEIINNSIEAKLQVIDNIINDIKEKRKEKLNK